MNIKNTVEEARSWCGTPFHPQGRKKQIGCDCIGLIIGVAQAIGKKSLTGKTWEECDIMGYNCYSDSILLLNEMPKHFNKVFDGSYNDIELESIKLGDIILFELAEETFHISIISDVRDDNRFKIVHSCASFGKAVEHSMPNSWSRKIVQILRF